jgi:hypothetical protein
LEFVILLKCEKSDVFPEQPIQKLVQVYDGTFDSALLKNELTCLYGSEDIKGKYSYKALQWFHSSNMATTFEET